MKKQKKYFIISTIIALFTALFFSCKNDIENAVASITSSPEREVAAAQEWYDNYKSRLGAEPVSIGFAKVKSTKQNMPALPDWKHTYTINDKDYSVVHVQLNTKGIFSFVTPENKQAYEATGNAKYIKTLTRMVVVNDKKNKVKHGFLMTLVPDKSYIESTHFDALRSNYKQWQKGYSGYVFYHTLNGKFNNAWRFENGKVTKEVTQQLSTDLNLDMGVRKKVASDYCIYTTYEIWSQNCMNYYSNSEYNFSYCTEWYYDYSITTQECYYDNNGSGGSGGDGGGGGGGDGGYVPGNIPPQTSSPKLTNTLLGILVNVTGYINSVFQGLLNNLKVTFIPNSSGTCGAKTVKYVDGNVEVAFYYDPVFTESLDYEALKAVCIHELYHIYIDTNNTGRTDDLDHSSMISDPDYVAWLQQAIPGKDAAFYQKLKYLGTIGSTVWNNLSQADRDSLIQFFEDNNFPYQL